MRALYMLPALICMMVLAHIHTQFHTPCQVWRRCFLFAPTSRPSSRHFTLPMITFSSSVRGLFKPRHFYPLLKCFRKNPRAQFRMEHGLCIRSDSERHVAALSPLRRMSFGYKAVGPTIVES